MARTTKLPPRPPAEAKASGPPVGQAVLAMDYPLDELHLDVGNPRFGGVQGTRVSERELVNVIADEHDLTDVLSSISANGYFQSEPLIGAKNKQGRGGITIVEGNRRLAACLILAGDERATDQRNRRKQYLPSRFKATDRLPVFVYDWANDAHRRQLLPYIGIRHIIGPLPWDSYAKAAWVDSVLSDGSLTLGEIAKMVGDKNRTMARLLEGFYFANQVEEEGKYAATTSARRGRGSKPEYPFSWVYNALDHDKIRGFVGIGTRAQVPSRDPIPKDKLGEARELMIWMFGDRDSGRLPAIPDSHQIGSLAQAVSQTASLRELRKGERSDVAVESARPKRDRVKDRLEDAADLAEKAFGLRNTSPACNDARRL